MRITEFWRKCLWNVHKFFSEDVLIVLLLDMHTHTHTHTLIFLSAQLWIKDISPTLPVTQQSTPYCQWFTVHLHIYMQIRLFIDLELVYLGCISWRHRRSFTFLPGGAPTGRPWAMIFFFYTPYIPYFLHFQLFIAYIWRALFQNAINPF